MTDEEKKNMNEDYPTGVIQGDCLEVLKIFPDDFIDCCVTSPPYYGLRDYGTGTWEGGDPNCNHEDAIVKPSRDKYDTCAKQLTNNGAFFSKTLDVCPKCGAVKVDKQIGLEETPEEYIEKLVNVFREVRRVLKPDGTLWLNIGDTYNGNKQGNTEVVKHSVIAGKQNFHKKLWDGAKPKDLIGIPWMLAFALRSDGWYLRQDIIWHKLNPMPESVKDRCTKSHEYIFLLSKQQKYYFDYEAIQEYATGYDGRKDTILKGSQKYQTQTMAGRSHERWKYKNLAEKGQMPNSMHVRRANGEKDIAYPVRNKRDVWTVPTQPIKEAHFATFPEELIRPCILAGSRPNGIVLDPFFGSGTTGRVSTALSRKYLGIELNPEYIEIAEKRTYGVQLSLEGIM